MVARVRAKPPARVGAPSKIDQPHRVREDGTTELIWEALVAHMAVQPFVEVAAGAVGVSKVVVYEWLKRGAHASQLSLKTGKPVPKDDQIFITFMNAAEKARNELHVRNMTLIAQLARGNIRVETVTEKYDGAGKLVERTVKADHTLPDLKALTWTQEHAFPGYYSSRARVEITGADGGPVEVSHTVDAMVERVTSALERTRAAAIDTEATEALEAGDS